MSRARLHVVVQRAADCPWLPEKREIRRWAEAAAGPEHAGEIAIRIVGEEESASLNQRYRARAAPTNVLAFPSGAPAWPGEETEPMPLGDLVICAPVVEREAAEQGKPIVAHFAHLVVHGTLHLVGYDHEDDAQARQMEDRERRILADFGIADPYG